jgi:hypothetical protein
LIWLEAKPAWALGFADPLVLCPWEHGFGVICLTTRCALQSARVTKRWVAHWSSATGRCLVQRAGSRTLTSRRAALFCEGSRDGPFLTDRAFHVWGFSSPNFAARARTHQWQALFTFSLQSQHISYPSGAVKNFTQIVKVQRITPCVVKKALTSMCFG